MNLSDYEVTGPNSLSVRFVDNPKHSKVRRLLLPGALLTNDMRIDPETLKRLIREGAVNRLGDTSPQRRDPLAAEPLPENPLGISSGVKGRELGELEIAQEKILQEQADAKGRSASVPGVDLEEPEVAVDREESEG